MSRLSARFIGVALVAGAFWVATQSYQNNFTGPALDEAKQAELGIQLLEFPRQIPPIERLESNSWQAIRLQPEFCDAVCQGTMVQLATLGVHIVPATQAVYSDLAQVTSAEKYQLHQDKILLINPDGKFAGSLRPPYNADTLANAMQALNP